MMSSVTANAQAAAAGAMTRRDGRNKKGDLELENLDESTTSTMGGFVGAAGLRQRKQDRTDSTGSADSTAIFAYGDSDDMSPRHSDDRNVFRRNVEFAERPRSVSAGLLLTGSIFFLSSTVTDTSSVGQVVRASVTALFICNVIYAVLNTRDSYCTLRPHPAYWRFVHACCLFYLYILAVVTALPVNYGQIFVKHLLGIEDAAADASSTDSTTTTTPKPAEENLGQWHLQCELSPTTLWRQLTSVWFAGHVIGWWGKMIIFRSWRLCLTYGFFFECLELSFQFIIPEFQECWWDSVLLDYLGANMIGLVLGHLTLKWCEARQFKWKTWDQVEKTVRGRVTRGLQQFLPHTWSKLVWNPNHHVKQEVGQHFSWIFCMVSEVNTFFIMNCFALSPGMVCHFWRQFFMGFLAVPALHEYYDALTKGVYRIGQNLWLACVIILLETIMLVKYGSQNEGLLNRMRPVPSDILLPWALFAVLYALRLAVHVACEKRGKYHNFLGYMEIISFAPLLYLGRYYAF